MERKRKGNRDRRGRGREEDERGTRRRIGTRRRRTGRERDEWGRGGEGEKEGQGEEGKGQGEFVEDNGGIFPISRIALLHASLGASWGTRFNQNNSFDNNKDKNDWCPFNAS